ncbi:MAG: polysaccharide biosynthesis C-terminal domain-containing protein [Candidatus Eremiobacteraeota bacterium]|nr:polysaccharide biosynthesis C-terminal domain-containing protein [Candidatus Eremiobacteraeota bacterium]
MKPIRFIGFEISGEKVARRMGVGFFLYFLSKAKGVITFFFFTRILGTGGYGDLSMVLLTAGVLYPLVKVVLSYGFRVYSTHLTDPDEIRRNFTTTLFPALAFSALNLMVFTFCDLSFISPSLNTYRYWIAALVFAMILKEYSLTMPETFQKARIIAVFTTSVELSAAAISIALLFMGFSVKGVVLSTIICYTAGSLVLLCLIFRDIGFEFSIDGRKLVKFTLLGLPIIPVGFFLWVIQGFDQYLIAHYFTTSEVGIYAASVNIAAFLLMVNPALDFAFGATILKLWNEKAMEKFSYYNLTALKWIICLASCASGILYLMAVPVVHLFASKEFLRASAVLPVLSVATSLFLVACMFQRILYTTKDTLKVLFAFGSAASISAVLNILLIPRLGINGAAIASLSANLALFLIMACMTVKAYNYHFYRNKKLYIPVVATLVFCGMAGIIIPAHIRNTDGVAIALSALYSALFLYSLHRGKFVEQNEIELGKRLLAPLGLSQGTQDGEGPLPTDLNQ